MRLTKEGFVKNNSICVRNEQIQSHIPEKVFEDTSTDLSCSSKETLIFDYFMWDSTQFIGIIQINLKFPFLIHIIITNK